MFYCSNPAPVSQSILFPAGTVPRTIRQTVLPARIEFSCLSIFLKKFLNFLLPNAAGDVIIIDGSKLKTAEKIGIRLETAQVHSLVNEQHMCLFCAYF